MSPPNAERAAPAVTGNGPRNDRHPGAIFPPLNKREGELQTHRCGRVPQRQCETWRKVFDKRLGRKKRFCSDACRKAAQRAQEARNRSQVNAASRSETLLNRIAVQRITNPKRATHTPTDFLFLLIFSAEAVAGPVHQSSIGKYWKRSSGVKAARREQPSPNSGG